MPYIIDGHNLIPKIPGLSLRAIDDEVRLIELLQDFCRVQRKPLEVYFDNAPAGQSVTRRYGQITAHFVRQGTTADAAIRRRLANLGKAAANWTVISSDLEVQAAARSARAQAMSAESFARLLMQSLEHPTFGVEERPAGEMSAEEVDEWLKLFSQKPDTRDKR